MKRTYFFFISIALYLCLQGVHACSSPSTSEPDQSDTVPEKPDEEPITPTGYTLQGSMKADAKLYDKGYADINQYMRQFGFEIYEKNEKSAPQAHG